MSKIWTSSIKYIRISDPFITVDNKKSANSSSLRSGSGMQSGIMVIMVRELYLLLYLFYQAELYPDYKARRPALPCIALTTNMSRDHFVRIL